MYENPDRFGFVIDTNKQDYENKKQVEFYFWMVDWFKKLNGNEYKIPIEIFRKVMKKFNPVSVKALEAHGFIFEISEEFAIVRNEIYPEMFIGANTVIEAGYANYKVNRDYFMLYCDFRAFAKYKLNYKDLHFILSDKRRETAEKIHEYAVSKKIMPQQCYYYCRVDYKHKGKLVFSTFAGVQNKLVTKIAFAQLNSEAFKAIENEIEKYADGDEYKNFLLQNFKKCTNCSTGCWKKSNPIQVFGKNIIVCGLDLRISDPAEQELKFIFRTLDLRAITIKMGISDTFYLGGS
jgi:hypothetical protein